MDTLRSNINLSFFLPSVALLLLFSANCHAADLLSVYKLAEINDPVYLQEKASYRASLESRPQAMSQLLPEVNINANTTRIDQDISSVSNFGSSGEANFNNRGYRLSVTQPLYRRDRFIALKQSDSEIRQAEAVLVEAQQDLIIRVAESYFNILASTDNLEFAQADVKSLSRQLDQANQRFEVGLSAITDVSEAQAGYDLAVAEEIRALNDIDNAREAMREITGDYINDFNGLGENMSLVRPEPQEINSWTELSLEQNYGVIATTHAAETARNEIQRQQSGHYPTLDLVGSHGYNSSGGRFGATKTHESALGLELNIPIYSGGLVSSQTREAYEQYNIAMHSLEQASRSAQRQTRQAYLGVISGISRVKALKQAVVSAETALEATEAGFEVGTRTAVDVVALQRSTSQARRNFSQAKYNYILDTLRLKQAAGTLSPEDIEQVNSWLAK
jgi:outer membrane protein